MMPDWLVFVLWDPQRLNLTELTSLPKRLGFNNTNNCSVRLDPRKNSSRESNNSPATQLGTKSPVAMTDLFRLFQRVWTKVRIPRRHCRSMWWDIQAWDHGVGRLQLQFHVNVWRSALGLYIAKQLSRTGSRECISRIRINNATRIAGRRNYCVRAVAKTAQIFVFVMKCNDTYSN